MRRVAMALVNRLACRVETPTMYREGRAVLGDMLSKCTPLRWVVTTLLALMLVGYSTALHMIYRAAHTPEKAMVESPRTSWSSKRTGQIGRWYDWQQQLATEAANFQP